MAGTDTPIVILNLGTQFSNHALNADRTDIPAESWLLQLLNAFFMMCRCDLHSASIERTPLLRCDQPADFFDEGRQRRFAVRGNGDIHFRIVSVVVNVSALRQILGANAD